ncbi:hypothetical protein COX85_02670, partial [Candidatus Micrarchaeota archaeon CG_4_10_14_0_2_um_filter_55_9]
MGASGFYSSLEEKWYGFCDSLQEKGLRVYDWFVDPVERRGIPSFPVALALIVLILGASFLFLTSLAGGMPASQAFSVKVLSGGQDVDDAYVKVYDSEGNYVTSVKTEKGLAELELEAGKEYELTVSKTGFETVTKTIRTEDGLLKVELLPKEVESGEEEEDFGLLWGEEDYDSESSTGELTIYARDEDWSPVSGTAYVYDANTNLLIESVRVENSGTLYDLELDSVLYVNFEPDDLKKYRKLLDGENDPITIDSGLNQKTLLIEKVGTDPSQEEFPTVIRVVNEEGKTVPNALVDVYLSGFAAPVKDDELTNNNGEVELELQAGKTYYATAFKAGYLFDISDSFGAGDDAAIVLRMADLSNSADVYVTLVDEEDNSLVEEAKVASFFKQGDQAFQIGAAKTTDATGTVKFEGLERGSNVELRASKGSRHVEA